MRVGCSIRVEDQNTVVVDEATYVQNLDEDGGWTDKNMRQRGRIDLSEITREKTTLWLQVSDTMITDVGIF